MKKLSLILILLFAGKSLLAQKAPYHVVFDVTSGDTVVHKMVMRWVKEIKDVAPEAKIEIVFYAKSLDMVTKDKSIVASDVMKYVADKNVSFKVCEVAMKNNNVDRSQLMDGIKTVPDGIYEIISKQHDGWGYIKAAR